jgi:stearoyl-CoA desaturase (delta-9 desaturase)
MSPAAADTAPRMTIDSHHHFPGSARQGFRWWELDPTYHMLRALAACGLVRDLEPGLSQLRHARPDT